ncbi:hypothetical protein CKAN_01518100 [Cinnamomum micranthum f. kanehirae]|uniref:Uncharacterized protein n=1 Tax=Cinnamomum micranthum f. kanehirae TaxID=337451 RepID=A0A3S3NEY6_9MAGN|nr:hypothetical protein CKAN_01518100 [Cinnamomum micranthum f. kanehirae]
MGYDLKKGLEEMPRRPTCCIGGSSQATDGRASSFSKPSRVQTKIGVGRPSRQGLHANASTSGHQRPTTSERRHKLQQDPLPESVDEHTESSSEDDPSKEDAQSSSPPQPFSPPEERREQWVWCGFLLYDGDGAESMVLGDPGAFLTTTKVGSEDTGQGFGNLEVGMPGGGDVKIYTSSGEIES